MADARLPDEPIETEDVETPYTEPQPITTKRLILREARKFDLPALHELYINKQVMRYWSALHVSVSQTESYLRRMIESPWNGELGFVIVLPPSAPTGNSSGGPVPTAVDEGKVIGHAGLWHPQRNELSFMIGQAYWRQGYMTEVVAALIPVFWYRGLKKVYADVNPDNVASLKVLKNFDFQHKGDSIVDSLEGWRSTFHMVLLNPDGGSDGDYNDDDDDDDDDDGDDDYDDAEAEVEDEVQDEEEDEEEDDGDDGSSASYRDTARG